VIRVWSLEVEAPASFLPVLACINVNDASREQKRWDSLGVDSAGFSRISKSESSSSNSSGSASLVRLAGVLQRGVAHMYEPPRSSLSVLSCPGSESSDFLFDPALEALSDDRGS
jgi:hypothetical protein